MTTVQKPLSWPHAKTLGPATSTFGIPILVFLHLVLVSHTYIWNRLQLLCMKHNTLQSWMCPVYCALFKLIGGLANIMSFATVQHNMKLSWITWKKMTVIISYHHKKLSCVQINQLPISARLREECHKLSAAPCSSISGILYKHKHFLTCVLFSEFM